MPKKYKLITPCAFYPQGTEARQENSNRGYYEIFLPDGDDFHTIVHPIQVEANPVWQLIPEVPEKKIVERWRGSLHEQYYVMGHNKSSIPRTEISNHENAKNHTNGDYFHSKKVSDRAITRTEIMCRLMGLAETIEEGSTEMRRAWTIGFDTAKDMDLIPIYTNNTVLNTSKLATFNTKENTQLFLDSAGQDAIDWYGAVK